MCLEREREHLIFQSLTPQLQWGIEGTQGGYGETLRHPDSDREEKSLGLEQDLENNVDMKNRGRVSQICPVFNSQSVGYLTVF